ncbi:unnamed protein product [Allacma fusca]|uniref:Integrase catalytic domain-containing protein n=1 Tax=Allacma fusca TaxID=39272 RepID=A0A8J2KCR4_9HEXA|nr:unnamed protein product [Allacma fusca]
MVNFINEIFTADLKDLAGLVKSKSGNHFVLVVLDAFSRKAYTRLLKNKNSDSMIQASRSVFAEARGTPVYLYTDRGTEFVSKVFGKFLDRNHVTIYNIHSPMKARMSERFRRTLFAKLQRYMTLKNTKRIVEVLPDFTSAYYSTKHRSIGMAPNEVSTRNSYEVWQHIYGKYLEESKRPRKPPHGDIVKSEVSNGVEVILSILLCDYFGISRSQVFKSGSRYAAKRELVAEQEEDNYEKEEIRPPVPKPAPGQANRLLVLSNLIENQTYEERCITLLKELKLIHDYNSECEHEFLPVLYLPLHGEEQNQIRVDFTDESLNPIKFGGTTTQKILHIRPKV